MSHELGIYETEVDDNLLLNEIKSILSDKEFKIFYNYVVLNYTYAEIGNEIGVTKVSVKKIVDKCKDKLKNNNKIKKINNENNL